MLSRTGNVQISYRLVLSISIFLAFIAIIPRMDASASINEYLWAEDGPIFINQAQEYGANAFSQSYAGYLHTYPRLISFVSNFFELAQQPYILFLGWLISFGLLTLIITHRVVKLGIPSYLTITLACLIALQPNNGEVFFNITNSQWMLGAGLTVYVLTTSKKTAPPSFPHYLLIFIMSLTGPFSILLTPVLLFHWAFFRSIRLYLPMYLTVLAGASIQALILSSSARVTDTGEPTQLLDMVNAFFSIMLFGAHSLPSYLAALLFWGTLTISLLKNTSLKLELIDSRTKISWLLLIAAGVHVAAAVYSYKHDPMLMVVYNGGNRYSWIPYTLLFTTAFLITAGQLKYQLASILSIISICGLQFHSLNPTKLQFASFANFSNYHNVTIPINPHWPVDPGWHINANQRTQGTKIEKQTIDLNQVSSHSASIVSIESKVEIQSNSNDPIIMFDHPISCSGHSDIGVEIHLERPKEGWVQLFWASSTNFSEENSLKRFYNKGNVKAQFAFPNISDKTFIRFDPMEFKSKATLHQVSIYCLP